MTLVRILFLYDNCLISDSIRRGELWEPYLHEVFEKYFAKDSFAIDAGAFIGINSVKMIMLCKKYIASNHWKIVLNYY